MTDIDFNVETCSEKYKEYIRGAKYGDTITETTKENMIFIYDNKKYTIKFTLEFSFNFDNGFTYTSFYEFKSNRKINHDLMSEFENYIKEHFVNSDRLSC